MPKFSELNQQSEKSLLQPLHQKMLNAGWRMVDFHPQEMKGADAVSVEDLICFYLTQQVAEWNELVVEHARENTELTGSFDKAKGRQRVTSFTPWAPYQMHQILDGNKMLPEPLLSEVNLARAQGCAVVAFPLCREKGPSINMDMVRFRAHQNVSELLKITD